MVDYPQHRARLGSYTSGGDDDLRLFVLVVFAAVLEVPAGINTGLARTVLLEPDGVRSLACARERVERSARD